jgi:hypothetical protein
MWSSRRRPRKSPSARGFSVGSTHSEEGYAEAFTDFFYITHDRTPEQIQASEKYISEVEGGRIRLRKFRQDEQNLKMLQEKLIKIDQCIR